MTLHRPGVPEACLNLDPHVLNLFRQSFQLDEQHRAGVVGKSGVGGFLHRPDGHRVHHLQGRRDYPLRDDCRHGGAGGVDSWENAEKGFHRRRQGQQPDCNFGGDPKRAFGTHENSPKVIAGLFSYRRRGQAAQPDHFTVFQHHLQTQDVVGGGAVDQAMGTAGVFGHVAPDAARPLARRVRGITHAEFMSVIIQVQVDHAGLHHGGPVGRIHL